MPSHDARPLVVRVAGRRVVCVGAGAVAAGKLMPFVDAGADALVVAPAAGAAVREAARAGRLRWEARPYADGDLAGAYLVIAATDDPGVNGRVAGEAEARTTWCVRVDGGPGPAGSAAIPAAVTRGALTMAVSTAGQAPVLGRAIRDELSERYGPEYGGLVDLLGELRADPAVQRHLAQLDEPARRSAWRTVLDTDILTHIRCGQRAHAREVAIACLFSSSV